MPLNENDLPLTQAEQAKLLLRYPRMAWWVGAAPHHPDIHRHNSEENNVENVAPCGMFSRLAVSLFTNCQFQLIVLRCQYLSTLALLGVL
jgi:hypothetical protein